ncbi:DUF4198 domain-containing protein [Candidatus Bathyarchaeota archaeon]|nr:MAG: DUF4198 domain-containing protein [Candidatus Bathyarchaeota archaeon]
MNRRFVPLIILLLLPLSMISIPHANANYRLNQTMVDTWPSTLTNYAVASGVAMADAATSGTNNIVTVGNYNNGTNFGQLRIYHKSAGSLVLDDNTLFKSPAPNYYLSGVAVNDIDGNGQNDTIFIANIGPSTSSPTIASQIGIFRWTGSSLIKEKTYNFTGPGTALETRSIAIWSHNGVRQIVTLGYYRMAGPNDWAQLGIWSFDGSNLNKVLLYNWTTTGPIGAGSQGYTVTTGDVSNNNGTPDIVTVGYSNNSTVTQSELRVWAWTGSGTLAPKGTRDWLTTGVGTVATTVTIKDLTGNGQANIIVGGQDLTYPVLRAELTVWSDWSGTLTQQAGTTWVTSPQTSIDVIHVAAGDVDASGETEIVTAGQADMPIGSTDVYYGTIRIWSLSGSTITLQKSYLSSTLNSPISAITVGDLGRVGKQDIIDGGQSSGKGLVEVRDVAFANSAVSLTLAPSLVISGQSISITGMLTNATDQTTISSAQVLLEYSTGPSSNYQILATVITDSQGRFASSWTPSGPGSYTIRATWNGDETRMGTSNTASSAVGKAPSVILLSSSTFNAKPGDTISLSGYLYPAAPANISITYTSPSGTSTAHTVKTDNTGYFTDVYTVDSAGAWKIAAAWSGNSINSGVTSNNLNVQTQPDPIQYTLATYGFVLAAAALAVGLGAFLTLRKRGEPHVPATVPAK